MEQGEILRLSEPGKETDNPKKKMAGKIKDKRHTIFNQVNNTGLNA